MVEFVESALPLILYSLPFVWGCFVLGYLARGTRLQHETIAHLASIERLLRDRASDISR